MNTQPIEKPVQSDGMYLDLIDAFDTLQGEGPFAGTPAVFIRLAGCNLCCPSCDTQYTEGRRQVPVGTVLDRVKSFRRRLVVITGGEPFRQNLTVLVELLLRHQMKVQIETNGTLYQPGIPYDRVTVVCSPKTPSVNRKLDHHVKAWKYVLEEGKVEPRDGLPTSALGMPSPPARPLNKKAEIFVQPLDSYDPVRNKANLEACVESCMKFGHRLAYQLHKICGLP